MNRNRIRLSIAGGTALLLAIVVGPLSASALPAGGTTNPTKITGIASSDKHAGAAGTITWIDPGAYRATFSTTDFEPDGHGPELFVITSRWTKAGIVQHIDLYHHQTKGSVSSDVGLKASADLGWNGTDDYKKSITDVEVKICNGGSKAGGGDNCTTHYYDNYYD